MTVAELINLLLVQDPEAEAFVFGENIGDGEVHTETVNSILSGEWGERSYVILTSDERL